jgi:parallel beta-helix repeat protein
MILAVSGSVGRDGAVGRRVIRALPALLAALLCMLPPTTARALTCGERIVGALALTEDLSCPAGHGIRLAAGAALDCDGHTITGGSQGGQYGIYVDGVAGAAISNCTVERFEVGIRVRGATGVRVYDNTSQDNTRYGIEVTQSSMGARIWRNGVYTNGDEGMHISGPDAALAGHQILENALDGNALEGIYLLNTHGNIVAGNVIRNHGAAGIYVKGSTGNSIADNLQENDPLQLVAGATLNVLTGNQIVGHKIKFDGASRNTVYTMSIRELGGGPPDAFHFVGASDNRLVDVEAVEPVDHHIRATDGSIGNVFVRMRAVPDLQCFIAADSSVAVTDASGTALPCGASGATTTTTVTTITTTTTQPAAGVTLQVRVAAGTDDAEERSSGQVTLTSSDLEMVHDKSDQIVGMRFRGVDVPPGARIASAYVQFQADETRSGQTRLFIRGEAAGDAAAFDDNDGNISARTPTTAEVEWLPLAWTSVGRAGAAERTPDVAAVIQEIVDHADWTRGNALSILVSGSGERVAESYDGERNAAPLLLVEY